jgi:hypothetical protein
MALGLTQPPIQWVPGALSLEVKRPGREADHSPHLVLRSRMRGAIPPLPHYVFMAWCLVKHRDFTAPRPVLGPTQSLNQCVPVPLSPGIKRPDRQTDQSPPSNAEVKNAWRYISTSIRLHGLMLLIEHSDNYHYFSYFHFYMSGVWLLLCAVRF